MTLGQRLKALRQQKGLRQVDAARGIGVVSHSIICHWETGRCEPSIYSLIRLARVYGVTLDELVSGVTWDGFQAAASEVGP